MSHLATGEPLSVQEVTVSFSGSAVLQGATVLVPEGGFTGIIGPNGSGKSTLLRSIARLLAPDGGAIVIGDDDIARLPRRELARRLALVEQNVTTDIDLTALQVVLLGRIPHQSAWQGSSEVDRAIALHHLEKVGMADKADRSWHRLSGGEQQRVQLARAFAQEPTVLALDEPTNHLDIAHALQLLATVQHIGLTVVAALHDLNLAAMFCDHLMVLHEGRVMSSGAPEEVLTPELLRAVYGVEASVEPNPITGRVAISFYPPTVSH
ncbi:ABC transporter ATP-binding protein [Aeromicrobium phragmitis]|uniref:ABC transporter ATP-binding protein n=1 Tax=Aeromicrobium phragmitis TaxID=2478914 RepID=A0A3L8PLZ0_9ACTN|nr:ABC transporter ATP-binding protein [Aeromicrobium phragmitis]RLV56244.1 ABC transporter ATP-binding protein [Aeromicrobium phragmitis]